MFKYERVKRLELNPTTLAFYTVEDVDVHLIPIESKKLIMLKDM